MLARRGRPTAEVVLSAEERETLERWAKRPKSAQALALRCRIVLAAAGGEANGAIAARLGRDVADCGEPQLARLRPEASPGRELQALGGPAVHREGARHRRALPEPARRRGRALCRREEPDPGARPHGADPAATARHPGPGHPRLPQMRHDQPLRRLERGLRQGHRRSCHPPPGAGVPPLPRPHRSKRPRLESTRSR